MRSNLPEGTAFFRGYEAQLIAIRIHCSEREFLESVEKVVDACESTVYFGISAAVDSSDKTEEATESRNVEQALDIAYRDLQPKKLLNTGSVRSQTLSSLVRALEETDAETEAHVRRTQKMGVALGRKLELSDAELTDLQLLCLLHDIGKISIPAGYPEQAGKTDRGGVGRPALSSGEGLSDRQDLRRALVHRREDPVPPRALGRQGLPGEARGRADPGPLAHHRHH